MWTDPSTLYVGVDYSITSPGVCALLKTGDIEKVSYGYFNKKDAGLGPSLSWLGDAGKLKDSKDQFDRYQFLADRVCLFLNTREVNTWTKVFVAIEGYSYGSTGFAYQIGENCAVLITTLKRTFKGCRIERIAPSAVKKRATGKGNADKEQMVAAFQQETGIRVNEPGKKVGSPGSDIADSYWVMRSGVDLFTSSS